LKPLITIITVVYNNVGYIGEAIESVLKTSSNDIQYIIIDGGSNDGTIEIVRAYGNKISKFISEPDKGIYDAMNKGLAHADGQFVAYINSDDYYTEGALGKVIDSLKEINPDILYADLDYINNDRTTKRCWRPGKFKADKLRDLWIPPHPTTFIRRETFISLGGFNLFFKLAADYDLLLRGLSTTEKVYYLNTVLVKMRLGGATNVSWVNIFKQNIEISKSYKLIFHKYPIKQFSLKFFNRFVQIFNAKFNL